MDKDYNSAVASSGLIDSISVHSGDLLRSPATNLSRPYEAK